jgi:diadenosine tetraphosphate (Ap4A) HIT family hydrolase
MSGFRLDRRLEADSIAISRLGLCQLRLMNDSRWPWLILVPQRRDAEEIFHLTPLDQTLLTFETCETARALKQATGCEKINVAALGNQVRQLHVHVVARTMRDPAWPGPVWGVGNASPYDSVAAERQIADLVDSL